MARKKGRQPGITRRLKSANMERNRMNRVSGSYSQCFADSGRSSHPAPGVSRRRLLAPALVLAAVKTIPAQVGRGGAGPILAYVGTYSSPQGAEGSRGRGQGIHIFSMEPSTGALHEREIFSDDSNPSWLAFDRANT